MTLEELRNITADFGALTGSGKVYDGLLAALDAAIRRDKLLRAMMRGLAVFNHEPNYRVSGVIVANSN